MTPPFETHPSLKSPHGFFGRVGGVSEGVYASLNTGLGSQDDPAATAENRRRAQAAIGADALFGPYQIHSSEAVILDAPLSERPKADGVVTKLPGLALSVLGADCGPVLLEDVEAGVIGACHAGWRGALDGIVESTVAAMCEIGASPANITAVLGPCISRPNYEVGYEFRANFLEMSDDYSVFFEPGKKGVPRFDLPAFILSRLEACGVARSEWIGHCTYANEARYFSHRRATHQGLPDCGRNLSTIMLPA